MSTTVPVAASPRAQVSPARALGRLLDELGAVVIELPDAVYAASIEGVSGSIGAHVRHCLDHVAALVSARPADTLSYDHRHRGTAVETIPGAALQVILGLHTALDRWPSGSLDEPVRVVSMVSPSGQTVAGWSTLGRELAFVVSHTIHHQALIGLLLTMHGHDVPDRFGHSPSTPRAN